MLSISLFALAAAQAASGKPGKPPELMAPPPIVRFPSPPPPVIVPAWPSPPAPPPPPPPAPPPRYAEPARARANLASLISDDDYPAEALFNEEEGGTSIRLAVGVNGRVTGCTITSSSGSPSLDETTCRILRSRARFTPARGFNGQPVTDTVSARVRWRIAEEPPEPPPAAGAGTPPPPPRSSPPNARAWLGHSLR